MTKFIYLITSALFIKGMFLMPAHSSTNDATDRDSDSDSTSGSRLSIAENVPERPSPGTSPGSEKSISGSRLSIAENVTERPSPGTFSGSQKLVAFNPMYVGLAAVYVQESEKKKREEQREREQANAVRQTTEAAMILAQSKSGKDRSDSLTLSDPTSDVKLTISYKEDGSKTMLIEIPPVSSPVAIKRGCPLAPEAEQKIFGSY